MLMGDVCTRGCRFCAVTSGNPRGWLDPLEPKKIAAAVGELQLNYVVLTSVDRDDLPDGGANHFAQTIRATRTAHPAVLIEVLIPDFCGNEGAICQILDARPNVIAHNIETTEALTPIVRDQRAGYDQSLEVLRSIKERNPQVFTKSSIMLGLGESRDAVLRTLRDLRDVGVDILTLGQYLQPTPKHLQVREFVHPETFDEYRVLGEEMGFLYVASGPLVRSSYRAGEYFVANLVRQNRPAHPDRSWPSPLNAS